MSIRLKHVVISVIDADRALKFYTEKMGFQKLADNPCGDGRWIELKVDRGDTCIVLFNGQEQQKTVGGFSNIVFSCEDIEEATRQLKEKGVTIVQGPVQEEWGSFTLFKDSEGNQFCISAEIKHPAFGCK